MYKHYATKSFIVVMIEIPVVTRVHRPKLMKESKEVWRFFPYMK